MRVIATTAMALFVLLLVIRPDIGSNQYQLTLGERYVLPKAVESRPAGDKTTSGFLDSLGEAIGLGSNK